MLSKQEQKDLIQYINQQKLHIKTHTSWSNFCKTVHLPKALVFDIEDIKSLQHLVRFVHTLNVKKSPEDRIILRAAAGNNSKSYNQSYSLTAVNEADIIIRLVGKEFHLIQSTDEKNIISAGASVQIGDLDRILYNQYDMVTPTSSLIPYVTVAGLSANAGHGTGKDQPSFAGLIKAMTLCLPNGKLIRIDDSHPQFEVIRASHLGLFGIVVNMELQCIPAAKMQCIMEARSVPEFLDELNAGLFTHDPYVSVMYVPTYTENELTSTDFKNVIIYRWRPVSKNAKDVNHHPKISYLSQELEMKMQEGFRITDLLRASPKIIPYFMRYIVSKFTIGEKDRMSVAPWPSTHYQTAFPKDMNDVDYLFPVSQDMHEVTEAFKTMITELQTSARQGHYPITYAVYLRLFKGTKGGLSTSDGDKDYICSFDIVSTPNLAGYNAFQTRMNHHFLSKLKAKPHWGKYIPNIDYHDLYGKRFDDFLTTLNKWYQENQMNLNNSMLLNRFACKILNIPLYPLNTNNNLKFTFKQPVPLNSIMAKKTLPYIGGNDEHTMRLRNELQLIAKNHPYQQRRLFHSHKNDRFFLTSPDTHTDHINVESTKTLKH